MLAIQEALERGALGPWAHWLTSGWRHTIGRTVHRTFAIPPRVHVVAVGGATLGGSGKTPVTIACALELAAAGVRTAVVGHAYRARPGRARIVATSDPVEQVGDEALVAARALETLGVRVVVAPTRAAAVAFAALHADVLVLDGISQIAPVRAALALLSLDAREPWGRAQALPPRGDLRAPPSTLLEACDAVVPLVDGGGSVGPHAFGGNDRNLWPARVISRGAWDASGALLKWEALRSVRIGLLTALGRPDRLLMSLARHGVRPRVVVRGRDHGPFATDAAIRAGAWPSTALRTRAQTQRERGTQDEKIELWLATAKCAIHARKACLLAPLATLDYSVVLHPLLCVRLRRLALP